MQNDMNDQLKSVSLNLQNQMKGVLDAIQNQMQMQFYTQAQMQTQMQELNKKMSTSDANFQQDISLDEEIPENCDYGKVKNSAVDVEGKSVSRPTNSSILNRGCKLPPFTGKERWEVWRNRFEAVAKRCGWSKRDMLDELLPRLQGTAAEFVYAELSDKSLSLAMIYWLENWIVDLNKWSCQNHTKLNLATEINEVGRVLKNMQ